MTDIKTTGSEAQPATTGTAGVGSGTGQALNSVVKMKTNPTTPLSTHRARVPRGGGKRGIVAKLAGFVSSCFKFLFTGSFGLFKLALWKLPKIAYRRYRGIRSTKVRRAVALAALLVIGVAVFFVWSSPTKGLWWNKEMCEFLARPAAKLYIDGELASEEVPPIYRTQLEPGKHAIRFVSPEDRSHEVSIEVIKGQPTQWFMNFVEDQIYQRSPNSEKGTQ